MDGQVYGSVSALLFAIAVRDNVCSPLSSISMGIVLKSFM